MYDKSKGDKPDDVYRTMFSHFRPDSILGTASRRDGDIKYLKPVENIDRQLMLPFLLDDLAETTKYICHNSFSKNALKYDINHYYAMDPKIPEYFVAKQKTIRELGIITLDCDVGRPNSKFKTAGAAMGSVYDAILRDKLPTITMSAASGRGCYLLWALRADDGFAPLNTRRNLDIYRACVAKLYNILDGLEVEPDTNSFNPAQFYKVPYTTDWRTKKKVVYSIHRANDHPPFYKLDEFCQILKIGTRTQAIDYDRTSHDPDYLLLPKVKYKPIQHRYSRPQGHQSHQKICNEIERISLSRGGFEEGCRTTAAMQFFQRCFNVFKIKHRSTFLKESSGPLSKADRALADVSALKEARYALKSISGEFKPKMSIEALGNACTPLKEAKRSMRGSKLYQALKVTPDEVNRLGLECIRSPDEKGAEAAAKKKTAAQKKKRQKMVDDLLLKLRYSSASIAAAAEVSPRFVSDRKRRLKKIGAMKKNARTQKLPFTKTFPKKHTKPAEIPINPGISITDNTFLL